MLTIRFPLSLVLCRPGMRITIADPPEDLPQQYWQTLERAALNCSLTLQ